MKEKLQKRYLDILRIQAEKGLDILEKMTVANKNYQQVVVNINNANNIAFQLETEIESAQKRQEEINEQKRIEDEKEKIKREKFIAKLNKESQTPKRKYTKKV